MDWIREQEKRRDQRREALKIGSRVIKNSEDVINIIWEWQEEDNRIFRDLKSYASRLQSEVQPVNLISDRRVHAGLDHKQGSSLDADERLRLETEIRQLRAERDDAKNKCDNVQQVARSWEQRANDIYTKLSQEQKEREADKKRFEVELASISEKLKQSIHSAEKSTAREGGSKKVDQNLGPTPHYSGSKGGESAAPPRTTGQPKPVNTPHQGPTPSAAPKPAGRPDASPAALSDTFREWCRTAAMLVNKLPQFAERLKGALPGATVHAVYRDLDSPSRPVTFTRSRDRAAAPAEYWLVETGGGGWLLPQPQGPQQFRDLAPAFTGTVAPKDLQTFAPARVKAVGEAYELVTSGSVR